MLRHLFDWVLVPLSNSGGSAVPAFIFEVIVSSPPSVRSQVFVDEGSSALRSATSFTVYPPCDKLRVALRRLAIGSDYPIL
eukprot:scaffold551598_cov48-Prasinocladus_malaysianus.AAC.1